MFNTRKIAIDKTLYERAAKFAAEAGYPSVTDFVIHMLERELRHLEEAKDEDEVRKRLEGLGYID
jgi:peptide methionine sulfoxide reductase MsrB